MKSGIFALIAGRNSEFPREVEYVIAISACLSERKLAGQRKGGDAYE